MPAGCMLAVLGSFCRFIPGEPGEGALASWAPLAAAAAAGGPGAPAGVCLPGTGDFRFCALLLQPLPLFEP